MDALFNVRSDGQYIVVNTNYIFDAEHITNADIIILSMQIVTWHLLLAMTELHLDESLDQMTK